MSGEQDSEEDDDEDEGGIGNDMQMNNNNNKNNNNNHGATEGFPSFVVSSPEYVSTGMLRGGSIEHSTQNRLLVGGLARNA